MTKDDARELAAIIKELERLGVRVSVAHANDASFIVLSTSKPDAHRRQEKVRS